MKKLLVLILCISIVCIHARPRMTMEESRSSAEEANKELSAMVKAKRSWTNWGKNQSGGNGNNGGNNGHQGVGWLHDVDDDKTTDRVKAKRWNKWGKNQNGGNGNNGNNGNNGYAGVGWLHEPEQTN
ncbi:hypothetical protein ACROYT_G003472 [Oculina patagonica]